MLKQSIVITLASDKKPERIIGEVESPEEAEAIIVALKASCEINAPVGHQLVFRTYVKDLKQLYEETYNKN